MNFDILTSAKEAKFLANTSKQKKTYYVALKSNKVLCRGGKKRKKKQYLRTSRQYKPKTFWCHKNKKKRRNRGTMHNNLWFPFFTLEQLKATVIKA